MTDPSHCPSCGAETTQSYVEDSLVLKCSECLWNETIDLDEPVQCPHCDSIAVMLLRHNYHEDAYLYTDYFCQSCRNPFEVGEEPA